MACTKTNTTQKQQDVDLPDIKNKLYFYFIFYYGFYY